MSRPRLLDLFCGAGGCSVGYERAGFDVVGVDINPQPHYPFEFHQADAMTYPLDGFDAIHASPPCQAYSSLRVMANAGEHPQLIDITRDRLEASGRPWTIENVIGAPMEVHPPSLLTDRNGVMLCGTMFGLNNGDHELRRHRLFESNVPLIQPSCDHRLPVLGFYGANVRFYISGAKKAGKYGAGDITGNDRKMPLVRDLLGIDWMTWDEARLAIPPAYTEFIGAHLLDAVNDCRALSGYGENP